MSLMPFGPSIARLMQRTATRTHPLGLLLRSRVLERARGCSRRSNRSRQSIVVALHTVLHGGCIWAVKPFLSAISTRSALSIIGATQKRHGLILRTSSDFIVRELLRSSGPLKAKARHPASQALAVLAASVASSPSCNLILGPRFLAAQAIVQHKGTSTSSGQL